MKILVVYENSSEEETAERVSRVIPGFVRDIARTLTTRRHLHVDSLPITARHVSFKEVVDSVVLENEIRQYITGLENAVFVRDGQL